MYLVNEIKELDRTEKWNPTFQMLHMDTRKMVEDLTQIDAKMPKNRTLNRYRDVLPYDETRVRLKTGKNDYINANYVEVPEVRRKYILTQGPLPSTSEDFWRMIWENNTKGIIMLNKIVEKDVIKCHPYWPMGEEEKLEFGDFVVSNFSCQMKSSFIIRKLLLLNSTTGENRIVKQFHFVMWPDFGVPDEPGSFLEFLDEINASNVLDPDAAPVVHCSAGIGRSGTFCLVDSALALAALNDSVEEIKPHELLLSMRKYRCGLVQTAEQLRFANIAIVYGLYTLFPNLADNNVLSGIANEANGDGSEENECEPILPPPLPPRRKKETLSPGQTSRSSILEQDQINQAKAYKQINELHSSDEEGSSDEEIIDLSNESSDELENESESTENINIITSYTKIKEKEESESENLISQRTEEIGAENDLGTKTSESSQVRRREIREKKLNTKDLVENIKRKMEENENRILPGYVWLIGGVAIGVSSLVMLAYHLYT